MNFTTSRLIITEIIKKIKQINEINKWKNTINCEKLGCLYQKITTNYICDFIYVMGMKHPITYVTFKI